MADQTQYSAEEKQQIQELLTPLSEENQEESFSPMLRQYREDVRDFSPPQEAADPGQTMTGGGPDLSGLESLYADQPGDSPSPADSAPGDADFDLGYADTALEHAAADEPLLPPASESSFDGAESSPDLGAQDFGFDTSSAADAGLGGGFEAGDLEAPLDTATDVDADFRFEPEGNGGQAADFGSDLGLTSDFGGASDLDAGAPASDAADFDFGALDSAAPTATAATPDVDAFALEDGGDPGIPTGSASGGGDDFGLDDLDQLGGGATALDAPGEDLSFDAPLSDEKVPTAGGADDFDFGAPDLPSTEVSGAAVGSDFDFGAPTETPVAGGSEGDLELGGGGDDAADFGFDDLSGGSSAAGEFSDDFGGGLGGEALDSGAALDSGLESDLSVDAGDLAAMHQQAQLDSGIGDEFTDEDLARIRSALTDYPPGVKKTVIDAIVNEKISQPDQRLLINMIIDQAESEQIADFLEARLGYRPDTAPSQVTKEGVQIIYTDELSPESLARRRTRNRLILIAAAAGIALSALTIGVITFFRYYSIQGRYEAGLEEWIAAQRTLSDAERLAHRERAEKLYQEALAAAGGKHDPEWQGLYGMAAMKAGFFDDAFVKLFGAVDPDYGQDRAESAWNWPERRAPLIRPASGSRWPSAADYAAGDRALLTDRDNIQRRVSIPGAYIVDRLRDQEMNKMTLVRLARFHSNTARNFTDSELGRKYKNDELAIDYYRLILTLMNRPDDADAMAGIGDIYYARGDYAAAAREYNNIISRFPKDVRGHAGLLNTYIQIWRSNQDPRFVLAKHREIRALGLEEELPLYLTAKLAGFYIDLDPDQVRIRYQVDPVDALSGLDIHDNAQHLLQLVFDKEENRDGEEVIGARYGEGFYQRGRFLLKEREALQALRQFQNAHNFDPRNFLAVNAMGEYYRSVRDFDRASQYFLKALEIQRDWARSAGARPEDETLLAGDLGKIYYNLGSLIFLRYAGFPGGDTIGFPDSRMYPDRAHDEPDTPEMQMRREQLLRARQYLEEAMRQHLRDSAALANLGYWMGWIDYMSSDFEGALQDWDGIDPQYGNQDAALALARANAYFYTDQSRASLGAYLKLKNDLERELAGISEPDPANHQQLGLFRSMASVYNNIGAIYEKEYVELYRRGGAQQDLRRLEQNALLYYTRAVDVSHSVNEDNEIARNNLALAFKYSRDAQGLQFREPLIDDWLPPMLSSLKDSL
ncbi:MAG: hypothetical protein K1X75_05745 [Leptospirales bacterium]|nr:hypothetical protein [Leptospirales bacterium]